MTNEADTIATSIPESRPLREGRSGPMRWFMVGISVWYIVVAIAGFTPSYLAAQAGEFSIDAIVHVHGVIMASWLGLLLVQTTLVANARLSVHRTIGLAATGWAAIAWISMWVMTFHGFRNPHFPDDEFLVAVLLAQLEMIVLFPTFFVWGFLARRKPEAHRRLMILSSAVVLQAAVDRMFWLPSFNLPDFWDHAIRLYVIVLLPLYVFDLISMRRLHRTTVIGTALIFAAHVIVSALWMNEGWHTFVHAILERLA